MLHTDTLVVAAVASVVVSTSFLADTEHLDQGLVSLVGLYRTDHMQPAFASCDDDGACLVVPCDQFVSNTAVGTVAMAEGSPFAALGVVVAGVHIVGAVGHPVDRCHSYAYTELAVVGVAAEDGELDAVSQ